MKEREAHLPAHFSPFLLFRGRREKREADEKIRAAEKVAAK